MVDLWQRIADGWHDALLVFGRDLRVVALNAPAAALFGSTAADLAGKPLRAFAPGAAHVIEPYAARAFDERNVFANDLHPFGDGEPFTIATHRIAGEDVVVLTLHRERDGDWPTDTGWAHRELAFANRQLQAYTGNTSLGFVRWDHELRILEWSPRAEAIFGWSFDEVRGRTAGELGFIYPSDAGAVEQIVHALRDGAAANISENRNVTKDGRVIHCRWFNSTIRTDGGFQIVSLVDDVTDLVRSRASAIENEERFRSLFEYSPDAMLALSLDGIVTAANAAAGRDYGYSVQELVGRSGLDLLVPSSWHGAREWFLAAAQGRASTMEVRGLRSDGTTFPVLATLIPIVFGGKIAGVHMLARDLTPIRRVEREVAAQSERLRELYLVAASANSTAESLIAATIDAGCRLLGMTAGSLYDAEADRNVTTVGDPIPRRLARLSLATDGALAVEDLRGLPYLGGAELGEEAPAAYIGTGIQIGGTRYGSLSFASGTPRALPFTPSDRDLVQLMGALVGSAIERGRARTRLKHLAYNDQLTALPNRAWITERLRDELALASEARTRVAVMFLDLDRFKDINDTLGHGLGDRMLRVIGDRLTSAVGADGLVARMGGDEFLVLVANDPTTARLDALATRVIATVDDPLVIDGYEQFVTASIGIAVYPDDGDDADTLIKNADVAMYRAKERGRNTHQFFTAALGANLRTRIAQEKSLRRALEREEFVLHYQPQFKLDGRRLCSFEALVRWQHPRLGLIGPDQFIPSAEVSGLIVGLGDWVLETACRQIRAWQAAAPGLRLAVNLSGRQFHQTALAAKISDVLKRTGLPADQLEVEITESVAMSDAAVSRQILEELRRAGVRLAVDDFGTGYSSLGYLRRFPLDTLKIDKSFVREIMVEPDDATIVRTVIGMAHSLGLEVCAEGVETEAQLAFLGEQGCDRVQGFLHGRPMAAEEVRPFLLRRGNPAPVG
jgi:diguanylate cyclase (GGDEF)-like protein/PAS domain S-box-containing protein